MVIEDKDNKIISFTISETKEIDLKKIFDDLVRCLCDLEVLKRDSYGYTYSVSELPEDVQRLIFSSIGRMMIDYAESKDF